MIQLQKIFSITYGNQFDLNKMSQSEDGVNFIGRTARNNGVTAKVEKSPTISPFLAGSITVALGGSVLSSFLQPASFYTGQNIAVLQAKTEMSKVIKLFYCYAIQMNAYRFSTCGREANRSLPSLMVPSLEEVPEWVSKINIDKYEAIRNPVSSGLPPSLDSKHWKAFKYKDLFNINRGSGPRRKDLDGYGDTPFVTSTSLNNGVSGFTSHNPTHYGNTITVNRNGSVGEAFYQPKPFCSTEDVHIFTPKAYWRDKMNASIGLFLSTLIQKEKYRFNYGRKWGLERMRESLIYLPTTPDGQPDWIFMQSYIEKTTFSSGIEAQF